MIERPQNPLVIGLQQKVNTFEETKVSEKNDIEKVPVEASKVIKQAAMQKPDFYDLDISIEDKPDPIGLCSLGTAGSCMTCSCTCSCATCGKSCGC